MANSDHLNLSTFIKSIHTKLRMQSKLVGSDLAWRNHCKDEHNLKKYAEAMQKLATSHWEKNNKKESKMFSRIEWTYIYCKTYFKGPELHRQRLKEQQIAAKINLEELHFTQFQKLKIVDVGSCYNPFGSLDLGQVFAIDIAPASKEVYKGDFLNITLFDKDLIDCEKSEVTNLPKRSFDVVIFSLFLEYLPTSQQRLICCKKAYDILKYEGLLIIITPDSKHVGANAKIMKSWRWILADIGFSRIKYEKLPHIHCMAFRKTIHKDIARRWAVLNSDAKVYDFVIPQDFNKN